jgi:hypothetical protein
MRSDARVDTSLFNNVRAPTEVLSTNMRSCTQQLMSRRARPFLDHIPGLGGNDAQRRAQRRTDKTRHRTTQGNTGRPPHNVHPYGVRTAVAQRTVGRQKVAARTEESKRPRMAKVCGGIL